MTKPEPKFKVGQWVRYKYGDGKRYKIKSLEYDESFYGICDMGHEHRGEWRYRFSVGSTKVCPVQHILTADRYRRPKP